MTIYGENRIIGNNTAVDWGVLKGGIMYLYIIDYIIKTAK
jgi:hypothetical protein